MFIHLKYYHIPLQIVKAFFNLYLKEKRGSKLYPNNYRKRFNQSKRSADYMLQSQLYKRYSRKGL